MMVRKGHAVLSLVLSAIFWIAWFAVALYYADPERVRENIDVLGQAQLDAAVQGVTTLTSVLLAFALLFLLGAVAMTIYLLPEIPFSTTPKQASGREGDLSDMVERAKETVRQQKGRLEEPRALNRHDMPLRRPREKE